MQNDKLQKISIGLCALGNLVLISTVVFAGIETKPVFVAKYIGRIILLIGVICFLLFWMNKRREKSIRKTQ